MIVQFILKGLVFYFLFLFVRSFFKGAKNSEIPTGGQGSHQKNHHRASKTKSSEDVVEADFRRL